MTMDPDARNALMRRVHHAPVEVRRTLAAVARRRLLHGDGLTLPELWSMYTYGDLEHCTAMPSNVQLLGELHPYGLRWTADEERSTHLAGPVYQWLRPAIVHQMTQAGQWPPRRRYHGKRDLRRQPL